MPPTNEAVSRRHLLRGTSAASGLLLLSPQTVRGYQANSKIQVGLIGTGNRGSYDATIVNADPRAKVSALADLFDDRIETAKAKIKCPDAAVYKDFEKLLASNVDAVIIATPPFEHPRMLAAAVEANKHIYCEKPMGVDVAGVKQVIAASRKQNPKKNLSVGFQQRYGPVYLEAYKRLQAGDLGPLVTARGFWISSDPFKRIEYGDPKLNKLRNWFCYRDLSGDFIVEQDIHNFDVLHWFLGGLPVRAIGYGGRKVRTNMEILDNLSVIYEFPEGVHVNFEANQITPAGFSHVGEEFTGTKGTIATSRQKMTHFRSGQAPETIDSKRDITNDAFEAFLTRIQNGDVENVGERSALSTMIALLGRAAVYSGKEATWQGEFGT